MGPRQGLLNKDPLCVRCGGETKWSEKENYGKIPKIRKYFYLIRYGESIGAAGEDV